MQIISQVETSIITKLEVLNYFVLVLARFGHTIRIYTTGYSPTAYIRGFHEALIQSLSNFEVTEIERLRLQTGTASIRSRFFPTGFIYLFAQLLRGWSLLSHFLAVTFGKKWRMPQLITVSRLPGKINASGNTG